jgi:hypothetical protein
VSETRPDCYSKHDRSRACQLCDAVCKTDCQAATERKDNRKAGEWRERVMWERWAESCPVRRMESCYEDREVWYLCGDFGNTPCKPDKYCPTRAVRVQAEDRQRRAERERKNAEYLAREQETERQSQERLRRMVTRTRYRGKP